jgi:chromosome segregation ATPase
MACCKMKNQVTVLLHAAMLFLACATAIDAKAGTDAKDRQIVHHMQLQLAAAQQEKAALADQVEALKKQLGDLEFRRAALEKKLGGQSRQISDLSDKQISEKQQQAELSDKYQEAEKKLKEMEQQYATTNNNLQQTQMEKEREKKKLDGDIQVCEKKNSELYQLSVKLMDKYQTKGVLDAMRQAEPFTQLEKVRIENLLQEYRDKADANRISSGSSAQDAPDSKK